MRRSTAAERSAAAKLLGGIKTDRKAAASRRNGRLGGQPPRYRLVDGRLERRDGSHWRLLTPPYTKAAHTALYRLRHRRSS